MAGSDPFLVFGEPCLGDEEVEAATEVLRSGWIGTGPRCHAFEREFAEHKGVPEALAVNSCTSALWLALRVLGVGPGTEVITTPVTFAASCNVVEHLGARPVFADVEPSTGNMDVSSVAGLVSEKTSAILVVHLAGRPVDLGPLLALRESRGIPIIEDCAHAVSGAWRGSPLGTIGDAGAFSFYATKNITTAEGGMLLLADSEKLDRCRRLAQHGLSADAWTRYSADGDFKHFRVEEPGFKFNLPDLLAAIGSVQLRKLETHDAWRRRLFDLYREELVDLPLELPPDPVAGDSHGYHLFSPRLRLEEASVTRDELLSSLRREHGIGTGVHYTSLHMHPFYRDTYALEPEDLPAAAAFSERTFSVPLSGCLEEDSVRRVAGALRRVLGRS